MKVGKKSWNQCFKGKKLDICILGGGNIGTLLLGDIGLKEDVSIRLFTSNPNTWSHEIEVYNVDNIVKYSSKIDVISDRPIETIADADIVISTLPSHIFPRVLKNIKPFIKPGTWIGMMPGSGGSEFYCKDLIENGCVFFGFQRVHGIARVKEYGKSVYDLGKKNELYIGTIPSKSSEKVCKVMEDLLDLKCNSLPNYLNITLAPSNPILHTARLYSMFYDYVEGMYWNKPIYFYKEWTDKSSEILIACDQELQEVCHKVAGLDLTGVKSLKDHYESDTPERMTNKITNIDAFKEIEAPMIETKLGYIPDFNSRYILEDFPYGLCIIKGFCDVIRLDTPFIDKVLMWFEKVMGVNYYIDGDFVGNDLAKLPLPKNYGLNTVEDIILYYR